MSYATLKVGKELEMKLFEGLEKNLGIGVFLAQTYLTSKIAANAGWGRKADEWVDETQEELKEKLVVDGERLRGLISDLDGTFDDFLDDLANHILSYLDSKYQPSDDEQASAASMTEEDEETEAVAEENLNEAVADFLNTFAPATSVVDDEFAHLTGDYILELINSSQFSLLSDEVNAVLARIEEAKASGNVAELDRLIAMLKKARISVEFRGERVSWHIF